MNITGFHASPNTIPQASAPGIIPLQPHIQREGNPSGPGGRSSQISPPNFFPQSSPPSQASVHNGSQPSPSPQSGVSSQFLPPSSPSYGAFNPSANVAAIQGYNIPPQPEPPPPPNVSPQRENSRQGRQSQLTPPTQSPQAPMTSQAFAFGASQSQQRSVNLQSSNLAPLSSQGSHDSADALLNQQQPRAPVTLAQSPNPPPPSIITPNGINSTHTGLGSGFQANANPSNSIGAPQNPPLQGQERTSQTIPQSQFPVATLQNFTPYSDLAPSSQGSQASNVMPNIVAAQSSPPPAPATFPPASNIQNTVPAGPSVGISGGPSNSQPSAQPFAPSIPLPPNPLSVTNSTQQYVQQGQPPMPLPPLGPQLPRLPSSDPVLPLLPSQANRPSQLRGSQMPPVPLPMPEISQIHPTPAQASQLSQPNLSMPQPSQSQQPPPPAVQIIPPTPQPPLAAPQSMIPGLHQSQPQPDPTMRSIVQDRQGNGFAMPQTTPSIANSQSQPPLPFPQQAPQAASQPPNVPQTPLPMPPMPQRQPSIPRPQLPSQQITSGQTSSQPPIPIPIPQPPGQQGNGGFNPVSNQSQPQGPAPQQASAVQATGAQNPLPMPTPPGAAPQPPRTQIPPDPYVEAAVRYKLHDPLLQGYDIPVYPVPLGTAGGPLRGQLYYQAGLMTIANKFHEWTQIFEGPATKELMLQHRTTIQNCLRTFAPIERGLLVAIESQELTLEAIYLTPTYRRLLAEHLIALDIYVSVFLPFYPGLDMSAGKILATVTDELYRDRKIIFNKSDL
jgi:hypothetical protein